MVGLIHGEAFREQALRLEACIKFEINDVNASKELVGKLNRTLDVTIDQGSILFKEGNVDGALALYLEAYKITNHDSELCYYIASCFYNQKKYPQSLKYIGEIVEHGILEYPGKVTH